TESQTAGDAGDIMWPIRVPMKEKDAVGQKKDLEADLEPPGVQWNSALHIKGFIPGCSLPGNYIRAIASTEIKMPAGNGITCGVERAGGFSGKNSPYTLLMTLKSLPATIKMVVFTTLPRLLPASS